MKLFVTIPFKHDEEKVNYLVEVIETLHRIECEKKIIVHTNSPDFSLGDLADIKYVQLENPWMLTWVHKQYFPWFLLSDFTHLLYLESDIKLTPTTFDYWLKTRRLFKSECVNFVPGFLCVEYKDQQAYSVAFHGDYKVKPIFIGNKLFFCPENSYQCMFIMDKELAFEHMNNESFYPNVKADGLGVPEAANSAYLHFNIPPNFPNRILLPFEDFSKCWIYHLPNKYVNMPADIHGKIPVDEILGKVRREFINDH